MPKFQQTYCSQCGGEFGPGDEGFSHCRNHRGMKRLQPQIDPYLGCPECGGNVRVFATAWVLIDGTADPTCCDVDWKDNADCECPKCGWAGSARTARAAATNSLE